MLGLETLPSLLRDAAERFGDHPAYVEGDRTVSYAALLVHVEVVAARYAGIGLGRGDRVVLWGPNSIDWAIAALAVSYAGGVLVPVNSRYVGPRSPTSSSGLRPGSSWSTTGSSAATRWQNCRMPACPTEVVDPPGHRSPQPHRSSARPPCHRSRRRRRHPLHLRHHRPVQGRDERAPADHRRRPGLGRAGRGPAGRPLPGGQPVLPLLRLQDRHRGRTADRLHALPRRDLRRRGDDAADRVRADHGVPRGTHALPVAAQRSRPRRARPVLAATRRDRGGRRTRCADREDARRAGGSTRW